MIHFVVSIFLIVLVALTAAISIDVGQYSILPFLAAGMQCLFMAARQADAYESVTAARFLLPVSAWRGRMSCSQ